MKKIYDFKGYLARFLPEKSLDRVVSMINAHPIHLILKDPRNSVHGDFLRSTHKRDFHRITINADLNPYMFLIVFLHEYAHLLTSLEYPYAQAHGKEWKNSYKTITRPFIEEGVFPEDVKLALLNYFRTTPASTSRDLNLMRVLSRFDKKSEDEILLEELPQNAMFVYSGKTYIKGSRQRKRIRCVLWPDKTVYLFNPIVKVKLYRENS